MAPHELRFVAMAEDARLRDQVYREERPAEDFAAYHERARTKEPGWVYDVARVLTSLIAWGGYRTLPLATENVPKSGPLLLAPNHFSAFDHFFMGCGLRRKTSFMAKSHMFTPPMDRIYKGGGVFPVRRGARDEEAFVTANAILRRGGCVTMYCEGGRSRTAALAESARPGIGRLALESGATIVPVAIEGSAKARNWTRGRFPSVTVLFGEPFRYEAQGEGAVARDAAQAAADEIFSEIRSLYAVLQTEGRSAVARRVRDAQLAG